MVGGDFAELFYQGRVVGVEPSQTTERFGSLLRVTGLDMITWSFRQQDYELLAEVCAGGIWAGDLRIPLNRMMAQAN